MIKAEYGFVGRPTRRVPYGQKISKKVLRSKEKSCMMPIIDESPVHELG